MLESSPMRTLRHQAHGAFRRPLQVWQISLPLFICLHVVGCSTGSPLTPVGEGPLGKVALERLASRGTTAKYGSPQTAFQASHPARVPVSVISHLLAGLSVSGLERQGTAVTQQVYPLFSHEEREFLAPLLVRALAEAQVDQRIRFTLHDDGLRTQGTISVQKSLLRVILSHYRAGPSQTDTRPATLTLSFSPAQALVQTDSPQSWMNIEPDLPHVAVSIDALAQLPPSPTAPSEHQSVREVAPQPLPVANEQTGLHQELQATKNLVVKQAEELQQLKADIDMLRRQLAEKESPASKAKPKPAPRKSAPAP